MERTMAKVKAAIGRCKKWISFENMFKAVILLMVWGLLSSPVAVFYASKEKSTSADWLDNISKLLKNLEGNCDAGKESDFNGTSNRTLAQDCFSSDTVSQSPGPWSKNDRCLPLSTGLCAAHQTMGNSSAVQPYYSVLKEVFRIWDPEIPFNCSTATSEVNKILIAIRNITRSIAPNCEKKGIPFFCSYLLPTCNRDGEVIYATVEECEYIRDDACKTVWTLASSIRKYGSLLPRCSELLNVTASNRSRSTTEPRAKPPTCHPLFVQTDCVCLPSCGTFTTRTDSEQAIENAMVFLAIIACFVSGAIYVAFLVKRRKAMLKYPTVMVLYATICVTFLAVIVFIGKIVPENSLFCSHSDLLHTMTDFPTPFCVISGITFHVTFILAFSFWTVHIIHIWITVDLPNLKFTKKLKTHSKVVHIVVVSSCILHSILGPIVALAMAKYKYVVTSVPGLACTPDNLDFVFYSLILPCVILVATSTSFLVLLFWTVYKKQEILRGRKCLKTPELKILCLSLFYIIWGVVVLAWFGERTGSHSDFMQRVIEFGLCHLGGESASLDCPSHDSITDTEGVVYNCLSYFLLGCLPVFSLIFAFTSSDLERVVVCCKRVVRPSETPKMYLSAFSGLRKADSDSQRMPLVSEYHEYQDIPRNI